MPNLIMSNPTREDAHPQAHQPPDPKAVKILAKSIYKELKMQGCDAKQVVSLATELISLVTSDLQNQ